MCLRQSMLSEFIIGLWRRCCLSMWLFSMVVSSLNAQMQVFYLIFIFLYSKGTAFNAVTLTFLSLFFCFNLFLIKLVDLLSYSFTCTNSNQCNFTQLLNCVNNTCNCMQQLYWNSTNALCGRLSLSLSLSICLIILSFIKSTYKQLTQLAFKTCNVMQELH